MSQARTSTTRPTRSSPASRISKCCCLKNPVARRKPSLPRTRAIGGIHRSKGLECSQVSSLCSLTAHAGIIEFFYRGQCSVNARSGEPTKLPLVEGERKEEGKLGKATLISLLFSSSSSFLRLQIRPESCARVVPQE